MKEMFYLRSCCNRLNLLVSSNISCFKCYSHSCNWIRTLSQFKPHNYYDVLQIEPSATPEQVKEAFLKLSKELHPDRNPEDSKSHNDFIKLNEAFLVLKSPEKRRSYDLSLGLHQYSMETDTFAASNIGGNQNISDTDRVKQRFRAASNIQFKDFGSQTRDIRRRNRVISEDSRRVKSTKGYMVKLQSERIAIIICSLILFWFIADYYRLVAVEQSRFTSEISHKAFDNQEAHDRHRRFFEARKEAAQKNRTSSVVKGEQTKTSKAKVVDNSK